MNIAMRKDSLTGVEENEVLRDIVGVLFRACNGAQVRNVDVALCVVFGTQIVFEHDDLLVEITYLIDVLRELGHNVAADFWEQTQRATGFAYALFPADCEVFS